VAGGNERFLRFSEKGKKIKHKATRVYLYKRKKRSSLYHD